MCGCRYTNMHTYAYLFKKYAYVWTCIHLNISLYTCSLPSFLQEHFTLLIGSKQFGKFQDLQTAIAQYEEDTKTIFRIDRSDKVDATNKLRVSRAKPLILDDGIVYARIKYACCCAGDNSKKFCRGLRKTTRTLVYLKY